MRTLSQAIGQASAGLFVIEIEETFEAGPDHPDGDSPLLGHFA